MDATEETRQSRHNQEVMCSIIMFDYLSLLYVALSLSLDPGMLFLRYTRGVILWSCQDGLARYVPSGRY